MNVKKVVNIDRIFGALTGAINWRKVQHSFSFSIHGDLSRQR